MPTALVAEVENNLAALRQQRGLSAASLAKMAGVRRQTVYAMEAGAYVPNTAVALRLARALDTSVENLFTLTENARAPELRSEEAWLLPGAEPLRPGQPIQLCRVDRRLVAAPPSSIPWYFPVSDAIVAGEHVENGKAEVQVYHPDRDFRNCILVAGCDPGISVLARHARSRRHRAGFGASQQFSGARASKRRMHPYCRNAFARRSQWRIESA